jgi:hypothetical protein
MARARPSEAFRSVQPEPAAIDEIAGCDSDEDAREQSGAIIDSAPRLRQRFPMMSAAGRLIDIWLGGSDNVRKEAAT